MPPVLFLYFVQLASRCTAPHCTLLDMCVRPSAGTAQRPCCNPAAASTDAAEWSAAAALAAATAATAATAAAARRCRQLVRVQASTSFSRNRMSSRLNTATGTVGTGAGGDRGCTAAQGNTASTGSPGQPPCRGIRQRSTRPSGPTGVVKVAGVAGIWDQQELHACQGPATAG